MFEHVTASMNRSVHADALHCGSAEQPPQACLTPTVRKSGGELMSSLMGQEVSAYVGGST